MHLARWSSAPADQLGADNKSPPVVAESGGLGRSNGCAITHGFLLSGGVFTTLDDPPSLIPGFKTVSMRDVIVQPGSKIR